MFSWWSATNVLYLLLFSGLVSIPRDSQYLYNVHLLMLKSSSFSKSRFSLRFNSLLYAWSRYCHLNSFNRLLARICWLPLLRIITCLLLQLCLVLSIMYGCISSYSSISCKKHLFTICLSWLIVILSKELSINLLQSIMRLKSSSSGVISGFIILLNQPRWYSVNFRWWPSVILFGIQSSSR